MIPKNPNIINVEFITRHIGNSLLYPVECWVCKKNRVTTYLITEFRKIRNTHPFGEQFVYADIPDTFCCSEECANFYVFSRLK